MAITILRSRLDQSTTLRSELLLYQIGLCGMLSFVRSGGVHNFGHELHPALLSVL